MTENVDIKALEDIINKPNHYRSPFKTRDGHYLEAIDVIIAWGIQKNFYLGNLLKYVLRSGKKADNDYLQDLKKARYYIDMEIKELESAQ